MPLPLNPFDEFIASVQNYRKFVRSLYTSERSNKITNHSFAQYSQWNRKPIDDSPDEYSRMDGGQLESAVVSLTHYHSGREAKLVGAYHIGSPAYYQRLADELAAQDIVLYEGVKPREDSKLLHFFSAFSRVHFDNFYRAIGREMTKIQKQNFDQACLIRQLMELFVDHPSSEEMWPLAAPYLSCISQGEAFDYHHLPQNWVNADLSVDQLSCDWKVIFSQDNLKCFGLYFSIKNLGLEKVSAMAARSLLSNLSQPHKEKSTTLSLVREQEVFKHLAEVEQKTRFVGIFYGASHLESLENGLVDRGYERTAIKYVPVMWKKWTIEEVMEKVLAEEERKKITMP